MKKLLTTILTCISFASFCQQSWIEERESGSNIKAIENFRKAKSQDQNLKNKPFERWIYKWEDKLDNLGNIPAAGYAKQEFDSYKRSNKINSRTPKLSWVNRGPIAPLGGIGRINTMAMDPSNKNIIYAGAAGGGLWKSINDGTTWTPLTDNQASLGVSGICIDPRDSKNIIIATGDADGADNYSVGILKSKDGGATWNTTSLNWSQSSTRLIRGLKVNPLNPDQIFAATTIGIYSSLDNGETWKLVSQSGNFYDLEIAADPTNNTFTCYASTSGSIFKSTDGAIWNSVYSLSSSQRIALATSLKNPNYVYAIASNNSNSALKGVYRSTDFGSNWEVTATTPNILGRSTTGNDQEGQSWYDLTIAAHPTNPEIVVIGGINNWKSIDGGKRWTVKATNIHVDKHWLEFTSDADLWEGNDGGLYKSTNVGESYVDKSIGLVISQMYKVGVSQTDRKLISGFQDNGTKVQLANGNWQNGRGGDGMQCYIDPTNSNNMYGSFQYGSLYKTSNGGQNWSSIRGSIPWPSDGAWVTPHSLDPQDPNIIYVGYKGVWKSENKGGSWTAISDSFANVNLGILEVAQSNTNVIFAATSSTIRKTEDGGGTWRIMPNPGNSLTSITIDNKSDKIIYATRGGYSGNSKVFKSTNGGQSWTNISGSSLPNLPANHLVTYNNGRNGLFLAMDIGVYYKDDSITTWQLVSDGLPNVEVKDIDIVEKEGKLVIATFGRGIWEAKIDPILPYCEVQIPKLKAFNTANSSLTFSWEAATGSFGSYEWSLSSSPTDRALIVKETADSVELTGLADDENYYFHLRAACSSSQKTAFKVIGPFTLKQLCPQANFKVENGQLVNISGNGNLQWMKCENGQNIEIPGATSTTYRIPESGFYTLSYTNNFCTSKADCQLVTLTNTQDILAENKITYYPNPSTNFVNIESGLSKIKSYELSSLLGAVIKKETTDQNVITIDINSIKAGSYLVKIQLENQKELTVPIIKL
jgi:photosystem II stability/assembly factor-like uncharacterized protein